MQVSRTIEAVGNDRKYWQNGITTQCVSTDRPPRNIIGRLTAKASIIMTLRRSLSSSSETAVILIHIAGFQSRNSQVGSNIVGVSFQASRSAVVAQCL